MMFLGVTLQYLGRRIQKTFMKLFVGLATAVIAMVVCFKLNWFALFDPTEPEKNKSAFMAFLGFFCVLVSVIVMIWAFKKFMRLAPTFIGFCAGFWFSIYFIAAINGIGGMFTVPGAEQATKDVIGPYTGAVIELLISLLGGIIGYNYSMVFILLIQTFISSYLIVRGSTLLINLGFPNEIVLMQSVTNETNGLMKLPTSFYLYSTAILGIWGFSFHHQLQKEMHGDMAKYEDEDF